MSGLIGLDFETYGATDLPTHGLARYINCKTFMPLIAVVKWQGFGGWVYEEERFDFTFSWRKPAERLAALIADSTIVAHNAPFEKHVLEWMDLYYPPSRFIDSAVVARAAGAGGKLEAAAPQLLGVDKVEEGKHLMRVFSIPGEYQEKNGSPFFDRGVVADNPKDWAAYGDYCAVDAELGLRIVERYLGVLTDNERDYNEITMAMNQRGWKVDVAMVEEMQRRYFENQEQALYDFRSDCAAPDLNLNSLKQLKEWCLERGVKANSFAEKPVEKLLAAVSKKLDDNIKSSTLTKEQIEGYYDVERLLITKQVLGGSSLKKLQVILDTVTESGRLVDQYLHVGASQTWRTTGRSVQMQNLKQLHEVADMAELEDMDSEWDNTKLANNIRQCFTATDENGVLIVGDFSSVEGRGLAWFAGAEHKLDAFRRGDDIYKVGAAKQFGVPMDQITKDQRQFGKVGELSCGYQAGPDAVKDFAAGMGVELSEAEATRLVYDWRDANPEIVALWARLDEMLHDVVETGVNSAHYTIPNTGGWEVQVQTTVTPQTLLDLHPQAQSIKLMVVKPNGDTYLRRYFHGCYVRGRNIGYYKPSKLKSGDLWKNNYVNPKTKQLQFYQIYGGKLAGILTQSMCREIFFEVLAQVFNWISYMDQADVVGQFHDEIVLDWRPGRESLAATTHDFKRYMSRTEVPGFPLDAEIKWDYRYTK